MRDLPGFRAGLSPLDDGNSLTSVFNIFVAPMRAIGLATRSIRLTGADRSAVKAAMSASLSSVAGAFRLGAAPGG